MPSPHFRPRTLPGSVWPPLPTPSASPVWDAYLTLDHSQWLDPEQLAQGQLVQLRTLLTHAVAHVPYYRDLFRERRIRPEDVRTMDDFRRLPLLGRRVYQAEADRLHAEALPDGMRDVGMLSTSGTSGVPIDVRQTDRVHLWWLAFLLRDTEWSGVDPRGSLAAIRPIRRPGALGAGSSRASRSRPGGMGSTR
jgi:phenylacetate-coenzyme A ligase PaaK-like adenylate-forming protein